MPDYTVKADVDTMLRANDKAGIRSAIGVGTTDAPTFLAQTLTGQSLTGTQATSLVDLATTWLSTTGTPTALKLNVTDTASNAASKLMDLQVGGVSRFNIDKNGNVGIKRLVDATGGYYASVGAISHYQGHFAGGTTGALGVGGANWVVGGSLGFTAVGDASNTVNLRLERDADGILAQRNGTAKQALRVYNTNLSGAPEWAEFDWITSGVGNTLRIGTNLSGTGAARPIEFVTGGNVRLTIGASGTAIFSNAVRLDSFFYIGAANGVSLQSSGSATGVLLLQNGATNNFDRVQLGNTTSAFPAIKRNGTGIDIRLADDSGFAPVRGKLTTDTAYTGTVVAATGYITIYDSTGQAYRVPCAV